MSDSAAPSDAAAGHSLPPRLAFDVVAAELAACREALGRGVECLDLSACADFDSSLIGLLLELRRQAAAAGRSLRFHEPPPRLLQLARLYGVESLLFGATESSAAPR